MTLRRWSLRSLQYFHWSLAGPYKKTTCFETVTVTISKPFVFCLEMATLFLGFHLICHPFEGFAYIGQVLCRNALLIPPLLQFRMNLHGG